MICLDSYSRQVFIYLDPIFIYINLWIDCLLEIRKIAVFPLAYIAGWLQGHWWGFISWNYVVWPTFLLMNVFIALKGSHFWFLFQDVLSLQNTWWIYPLSTQSNDTLPWPRNIKMTSKMVIKCNAMIFEHTMCSSNLQGTQVKETERQLHASDLLLFLERWQLLLWDFTSVNWLLKKMSKYRT